MKAAGWKFGKWLDVVLMQRQLGQGDTSSPTGAAPATAPATPDPTPAA
jgi:phosphinothricin acetyltransferase